MILRSVGPSLISLPFSTFRRYERHLSALTMLTGFIFDNYYFVRVDHPATQLVLFAYLVLAISAILLLHFMESRPGSPAFFQKLRWLFAAAAQFAFGGLWSAFLIFYGRSAVLIASWPFLAILIAMLIGNEMFRKYQSRLVFTCTLLFLALFSYAIFAVPVFTGTMGRPIFLLSGILAIAVFALVLLALWAIGPQRMREAWREIALGAAGILAGINLFYFANILPPLPLALANAGGFHSVTRVGESYQGIAESRPWYGVGRSPVLHVGSGEPIYLYSAVFAPIQLKTNIVHLWRHYDEAANTWRTESIVSFPITGGRDGGYRGYSIKSSPRAGRWRVDILTPDGLLIGRVSFSVLPGSVPHTVQLLQ